MTSSKSYSLEEQIQRTGVIVERFSEIEQLINTVIFNYIAPILDAEKFVKLNLLDNSVVSFGAKIKLLQVINKNINGDFINRDKFHRLLSIRNAFAHNNVGNNLEIEPSEENLSEIYFYIESMKGDGSIVRTRRDDAYTEFWALYLELLRSLQEFIKAV
ncbi:hypothetical protein [Geothrix fuzhouensis]|uniref:hypothetical protein n=1 Tax=Geothrix fuzhouensis TaxID=2966451 RepID=UPI0021490DED|nr:hypothetical protein [Geothrix fuzhouensis]